MHPQRDPRVQFEECSLPFLGCLLPQYFGCSPSFGATCQNHCVTQIRRISLDCTKILTEEKRYSEDFITKSAFLVHASQQCPFLGVRWRCRIPGNYELSRDLVIILLGGNGLNNKNPLDFTAFKDQVYEAEFWIAEVTGSETMLSRLGHECEADVEIHVWNYFP